MAIVNISLPDKMKEFIDERVNEGRFSSASEYFRDLVREDQKRKAQERLEALLLEGLDSGQPIDVTDEYIQKKRAELLERMERRGKVGR
jgi:antitoxin ParD1/3/4